MNLLFKVRVFLWTIVSEIENFLYPYRTTDPEMSEYYFIRNPKTGERYSIVEWIESYNDRMDSMEDNICLMMSEIRKLNKLDCDLIELKNKIYKNKEKN